MGARTLEAALRIRLLASLAPLLLAVGLALVALMGRALDALEQSAARARADAALRMFDDERAEGDAPEVALREVAAAADADRIRILVRSADPPLERTGRRPMLPSLASLPDGACASADDPDGTSWLGCARRSRSTTAVVALGITAARATLRATVVAMGAVILLALVGALLAARVAVRRPLADVTALAAWSRGVGATESPPPPPPGASAETKQLSGAFADVVTRLFDALDRERASSAHVAHELRTPLTSLRVELEALAARGEDAARRMLADVERLSDVIDAILVLSAPRDAVGPRTTVNVADVARACAPPGVRVEAPDEALVEGDARLLDLAVRNLVDNARKHADGARLVRVAREGAGVRVAVVDEGPGLSDAARKKMFDRFWRGAAGADGSGLGLALVRAVAERHGGRAEARAPSGGPPRGLEVSIVLPRLVGWSDDDAPPGR